MHADGIEQAGDTDLLVVGEDDAGGLLAVAKVVSSMRTAGSAGFALAMTKLERSLVI